MGFIRILILVIFQATEFSTMAEEEFPLHCNNSVILPIKDAEMFDNGGVYDPKSRSMYPKEKFWKDESSGTVYGCPCDLERPCLWKCCLYDQAIDSTSNNCTAHSSNKDWFKPVVNSDDGERSRSVVGHEHFVLFYGDCGEGMTVIPEEEYILRGSDGSMVLKRGDEPLRIEPDTFCVDYAVDLNRYVAYQCSNKSEVMEEPEEPQSKCITIILIFYPIGMGISIIFLINTIFVYACIPELRNLHGKCLMCHNATLLSAYCIILFIHFLRFAISDDVCHAAGFLLNFAFLSTFLWLNIMCIDMCIAFNDLRVTMGNAQERDRKKFLLYMLYAWGLPLPLIGISLYMEFGDVPSHLIKPNIRKECWFQTNESEMAYFNGPVATILTVNIALFIFTAVKIFKLKRQTKILRNGDSRRHTENKQRFNLYLKLYVVMGINWTLVILPRFTGGSVCIWIPAELFNTLQGFFIFLIFVWKDKVRRTLIRRFCPKFASSMQKQTDPVISSSEGRSLNTVSSAVADGEINLDSNGPTYPTNRSSPDLEQL